MNSLILLFITVSLSCASSQELLDQCKDVTGARHALNDSYIGEDGCNKCKCLEGGSACTRKYCPKEEREVVVRSAEADKCVDNRGVLHEVGESYTHVDGCNTCRCTAGGGACTRRFCIKERRSSVLECVDREGNTKTEEDGAWLHRDGCNKCICGPLGAICTKQFCGEHRGWTDEKNDAHIDEIIHTKEGSVVPELGDQTCRDLVSNTEKMPGDTWLSEDGCNICVCKGDSPVPACTRMGCRARLARLIGGDSANTANNLQSVSILMASFMSLMLGRLL